MAQTPIRQGSRHHLSRSALRKILYGLLALACLLAAGLAARTARAETLDQQNAPANWGGGAHQIQTRSAQTVSPTLSCLTRVEVALMTGNRGKGGDKVTLTVLDWSGITTSKQLAQVTLDVPEGFDGWLSFTIPKGGVTVPFQWLALQLNDTGKNVFWWKYQAGNPYPGGTYFLGGYGNDAYDYLFKTYGLPTCPGAPVPPSFTLNVTPDPVAVARGGSSQATVSVTRQGGFTGAVNVSFALPGGVTASPSTLSISGASAGVTLNAAAGAATGSLPATASGTASGATGPAHAFHVSVGSAAPALALTAASPAAQQRNATITLTGSGFNANCGMNTVTIAGIDVPPQTCAPGSLTAKVPANAPYGPTSVHVKVTSAGLTTTSNSLSFSVGRDAGAFVDITGDVVGQHATKTCAAGTARVDVASAGGTSYSATYKKLPAATAIGGAIGFNADTWYYDSGGVKITLSNIGGAGFSLCSTGLVLDGNGGSTPRLFLRDLDSGASYQASPFAVPIQVPRLPKPYAENYNPHFLRSPDGTLLLAVTAAPTNGAGNVTATFFDKVSGGSVLQSVPITTSGTVGNPAISATIGADNRVTLKFGSQSFGPYAIP